MTEQTAYELGQQARNNGILCYPTHDPKMMELICTNGRDKQYELMKEWREGWNANDTKM